MGAINFFALHEKTQKSAYIIPASAGIAQLVERNLAKVEVASSRLVSRSSIQVADFNESADCKKGLQGPFCFCNPAFFAKGQSRVGKQGLLMPFNAFCTCGRAKLLHGAGFGRLYHALDHVAQTFWDVLVLKIQEALNNQIACLIFRHAARHEIHELVLADHANGSLV